MPQHWFKVLRPETKPHAAFTCWLFDQVSHLQGCVKCWSNHSGLFALIGISPCAGKWTIVPRQVFFRWMLLVFFFKVLCFMLDHKLLEEMDFRLPPLTLHLYLFAPQSLPRWKSLQQHLPPSLSRHLALGAWIRHQAHLGRRRLQYPYLQSFNPQLLRSSRTPPCFDSFSQHFRLPCSSTMPVWTWQKSTKVRRNRFKSRLTYSTCLHSTCSRDCDWWPLVTRRHWNY